MIAALTPHTALFPDTVRVLSAPLEQATGWLEQPPPVLILLVVLTGVLLMIRPLPTASPERDVS